MSSVRMWWYSVLLLPKRKWTRWSRQATTISLLKSRSCLRVCSFPGLAVTSSFHGFPSPSLKSPIILLLCVMTVKHSLPLCLTARSCGFFCVQSPAFIIQGTDKSCPQMSHQYLLVFVSLMFLWTKVNKLLSEFQGFFWQKYFRTWIFNVLIQI